MNAFWNVAVILVSFVLSFVASVGANYLFLGRIEKRRAGKVAQQAYNKLVFRFIHFTQADLEQPLELMPLDVQYLEEDLRLALYDVNPSFSLEYSVKNAIEVAMATRKQREEEEELAKRNPPQ